MVDGFVSARDTLVNQVAGLRLRLRFPEGTLAEAISRIVMGPRSAGFDTERKLSSAFQTQASRAQHRFLLNAQPQRIVRCSD